MEGSLCCFSNYCNRASNSELAEKNRRNVQFIVKFRIIDTLSMQNQPPKSPNPPSPPYQGGNRYQGDFGNFDRVGVIGKCLLISRVYYKRKMVANK